MNKGACSLVLKNQKIMSGAGSMLNMQNTLKSNKDLRRSKRRKFRNETLISTSQNSAKREINRFKKDISKEDLEGVKKQIRIQIKKNQKKYFVLSIVLFSVFMLILSYFWTYIF